MGPPRTASKEDIGNLKGQVRALTSQLITTNAQLQGMASKIVGLAQPTRTNKIQLHHPTAPLPDLLPTRRWLHRSRNAS